MTTFQKSRLSKKKIGLQLHDVDHTNRQISRVLRRTGTLEPCQTSKDGRGAFLRFDEASLKHFLSQQVRKFGYGQSAEETRDSSDLSWFTPLNICCATASISAFP
eukprot:s2147_g10.t1